MARKTTHFHQRNRQQSTERKKTQSGKQQDKEPKKDVLAAAIKWG